MLKRVLILTSFLITTTLLQSQTFYYSDSLGEASGGRSVSDTVFVSDWSLKINEFCAINDAVIHDEFGEYDDWIEFYNFGEDTIDLKGLFITDDFSEPQKWHFDASLIVLPDSFLLIWADKDPEQGGNHLGFKLSGGGEEIAIYTPDSLMIDSVSFGQQTADQSMGRQPDGGSVWNYFTEPTPGSSNNTTGLYGTTPSPEFSVPGGFFQDDFYVDLSVNLESAEIHYTLDCSEPTESSPVYSDPLFVEATTVIRARAFKENWIAGPVATATYIFDADYTLDVISLVTQHDNFWGSSGIYSNPYTGVEKPIHMEYFPENGDDGFEIDLGVKIHSPDSRQQKSLRFYARSQYGEKNIDYKLFDDLDITSFKRFILRNGGNDGFERSKTQIRDPLAHIIYKQNNPENAVSAYKPVDVYLNGEYWGIYNMRERQDKYYIESHFGEEDIDFLEYDAHEPNFKHAIEGDWQNFNALKNYVISNDLSIESNYQVVEDWMDIENFVDYQAFEIFVGNQDWLSNNIKFWRPRREDAKWKWVLWDTEYGLALFYPDHPIGYPDFNFLHMALTWGGWGNGDYTYLLRNLVDNDGFREYFITRFADLLNTDLKTNGKIPTVIDSLVAMLTPDLQYQFNRWGGNSSNWQTKVQEIKDFTNGRPPYIRQHIIDEFQLDTVYTLTVHIKPFGTGSVKVNTITTGDSLWAGVYFTGYATALEAVSLPGYQFVEWLGTDIDTTKLFLMAGGDTSVTAVFKPLMPESSIVINEINYHSAELFDPHDWVELKNVSSSAVDLQGWVFKDEDDEHLFEIPEGVQLLPGDHTVLCRDTLDFKTCFPDLKNFTGNFDFGLSGSGEVLRLYDNSGLLADSVHYRDDPPWPVLPDGHGPTLELIADTLNNDLPQSWQASFVMGGTPGKTNSQKAPVKLFVNELMADNTSTVSDPQGEFDGWIELYNAGEQYIDVGGMCISNDPLNPVVWQFSTEKPDSTILMPGEFMLLWADTDIGNGVYHLGFELAADGGYVGIYSGNGNTLLDSVTYTAQFADVSYGRRTNAGEEWVLMHRPSPGMSNTAGITVSLKAFLEGAFLDTAMTTLLAPGHIPYSQPFGSEPWNYDGDEEVSAIPDGITDWILVELRDAPSAGQATPQTGIARKAGFIFKNGLIKNVDGTSGLFFDIYFDDSLYAVVWHRNHLAIMSGCALQKENDVYYLDLTESAMKIFGGEDAAREIIPGVWGMFCGDADADGVINNSDINQGWWLQAGKSGYYFGDFNLDGQVDNKDKNKCWFRNVGRQSLIPQ